MHEWTLVSIQFDWRAARVTLRLRRPDAGPTDIVADGVLRLDVPRRNPWGPSVSINRVLGPTSPEGEAGGAQRIAIEMQSGDVITVVANSFVMPGQARDAVGSLVIAAAGE